MKSFKKLTFLAAIFLLAVQSVSAVEFTDVTDCHFLYNKTYRKFIEEMSIPSKALELRKSIEQNVREPLKITRWYQIRENNIDAEDTSAYEIAQSYIKNLGTLKNNDVFMTSILRNQNAWTGASEGWIIISHYTRIKGFTHYMFFYSIG